MKELIRSALEARKRAYCPYSGFAVGAALQAKEGRIYTGCNIENAAFSPSCCAERTAFFKAVSEGVTEFERIVVVGGSVDEQHSVTQQVCDESGTDSAPTDSSRHEDRWSKTEKTTPCGVCLQVMLEFCDPETFEVVLALSEEKYEIHRLCELLPYGFQLKS